MCGVHSLLLLFKGVAIAMSLDSAGKWTFLDFIDDLLGINLQGRYAEWSLAAPGGLVDNESQPAELHRGLVSPAQ